MSLRSVQRHTLPVAMLRPSEQARRLDQVERAAMERAREWERRGQGVRAQTFWDLSREAFQASQALHLPAAEGASRGAQAILVRAKALGLPVGAA